MTVGPSDPSSQLPVPLSSNHKHVMTGRTPDGPSNCTTLSSNDERWVAGGGTHGILKLPLHGGRGEEKRDRGVTFSLPLKSTEPENEEGEGEEEEEEGDEQSRARAETGVSVDPEKTPGRVGYLRDHFREKEEVMSLITQALSCASSGPHRFIEARYACQRVADRWSFYQEQPGLLDPHLLEMATPLVSFLRSRVSRDTQNLSDYSHLFCSLLYLLTAVRGYKRVAVMAFPHEACDVEPVLETAEALLRRGGGAEGELNWESKYIFLLWAGVTLLTPFDLESIDSHGGGEDKLSLDSLKIRFLNLFEKANASSHHCLKAAGAWGTARLVSRKDGKRLLPEIEKRLSPSSLGALNQILKVDNSKLDEGFVTNCIQFVVKKEEGKGGAEQGGGRGTFEPSTLRKKRAAVAARLVCRLLPPPSTQRWRYQRGMRNSTKLMENLQRTVSSGEKAKLGTAALQEECTPLSTLERNEDSKKIPVMEKKVEEEVEEEEEVVEEEEEEEEEDAEVASESGHAQGVVGTGGARLIHDTSRKAEEEKQHWKFGGGAEEDVTREGEEEEFEFPEVLEDVISFLLELCQSEKDSAVRWTTAKSIGRVCNQISKDMAGEVLSALLEESLKGGSGRHCGCLSIAEMVRRGLVPADRLGDVISPVISCLEVQRDRQVRDAACYVLWAVARAFSPEDTSPYVSSIASSLVSVACFDREVNCRRAAAAAIQEHVGRQGSFKFGIELVTIADYWSVSSRGSAALVVGKQVAALDLEAYLAPMVSHLVEFKLGHADKAVRILSSKAVGELAKIPGGLPLITSEVLPSIVKRCVDENSELPARHGALLALGEVVAAVGPEIEDEAVITKIRNVVPLIEKHRLFRGRGSEITRHAACKLLREIALCTSWKFKKGLTAPKYLKSIDECLRHFVPLVQVGAADALRALGEARWGAEEEGYGDQVVATFLEFLDRKEENVAARRGYLLGLLALPLEVYGKNAASIEPVVVREATAWPVHPLGPENLDAEGRQLAVMCVCRLCEVGYPLKKVYEPLMVSLNDFAQDRRGDVGSWVRETAVQGVAALLGRRAWDGMQGEDIISTEEVNALFACLFCQAAEKIDRTRAIAGMELHRLSNSSPQPELVSDFLLREGVGRHHDYPVEDFRIGRVEAQYLDSMRPLSARGARREGVKERRHMKWSYPVPCPSHWDVASESFCAGPATAPELSLQRTIWASCPDAYRRVCRLLKFKEYTLEILKGLAVSIGSQTEAVSKNARIALIESLEEETELRGRVAEALVQLLGMSLEERRIGRLFLPLLSTIAVLMRENKWKCLPPDANENLLKVLVRSTKRSRDVGKLKESGEVLAGLFVESIMANEQAGEARLEVLSSPDSLFRRAIALAFQLVGHDIPRVRHSVAQVVYVKLLELDYRSWPFPEHTQEEICDLLVGTEWSNEERGEWEGEWEQLFKHAGLEIPQRPKREGGEKEAEKGGKRKEVAYEMLVREEHW